MITEIRGLDVPVKMSVLPNGLTVITAQTDSELVKVQFTLRVGSANEEKGQEGIAHYLEHALFEGPARNDVHPLFKDLS